ncbi:MAG: TIR domain-containing protein [Cyanobacteria bacterium K_Offshore_surface_m2_239]|nr:TIR domain-containing protein [Cyanobacteria bacterium K_Offshore_surface_m2_239]
MVQSVGYGYFRDKDHRHGVKAGDEWRQSLFQELGDARAMVSLCSEQYDSSPWCVGEVAIAVKDGKTVIPIQLSKEAEALKLEPLSPRIGIWLALRFSRVHKSLISRQTGAIANLRIVHSLD